MEMNKEFRGGGGGREWSPGSEQSETVHHRPHTFRDWTAVALLEKGGTFATAYKSHLGPQDTASPHCPQILDVS